MKYVVDRLSLWDEDIPPCEGAVKEEYTRIDERRASDPMLIPIPETRWYERGTNHRVENGHIKRDFTDEAWFIEIKTLEELHEFIAKYGNIIIERFWENPSLLRLKIYDDYNE